MEWSLKVQDNIVTQTPLGNAKLFTFFTYLRAIIQYKRSDLIRKPGKIKVRLEFIPLIIFYKRSFRSRWFREPEYL